VVACYSGQTAGQIVGSLRLAGFNAYSLSGGMGSVTEDTPLETEAHEFVPGAAE
jgi:rhodanese-related sulfurtransferase